MQGALEILGMPNKKLYKADPIFEPRTLETELFMGVQNNLNVDVLDGGLCPSGSLLTTFYLPQSLNPIPANKHGKSKISHSKKSRIFSLKFWILTHQTSGFSISVKMA